MGWLRLQARVCALCKGYPCFVHMLTSLPSHPFQSRHGTVMLRSRISRLSPSQEKERVRGEETSDAENQNHIKLQVSWGWAVAGLALWVSTPDQVLKYKSRNVNQPRLAMLNRAEQCWVLGRRRQAASLRYMRFCRPTTKTKTSS